MPTSIIPAAISSQLDNTGEERIHVANTTIITRPTFVLPKWLAWVNGTTTSTAGVIVSTNGTDWGASLSSMASLGLSGLPFTMKDAKYFNGKALFISDVQVTDGGNTSNRRLTTADAGVSFVDSNPGVIGTTGGVNYPITIGNGFIFRSVISGGFDGVWRAADPSGPWTYFAMPAFEKATSLAYKGTRLMSITTGRDYVHYSDNDGSTWVKGVEDAFGGNNIEPSSICATDSRFVVTIPETGLEGARWSTDGQGVWTASSVTMASGDLPNSICFGSGLVLIGCSDATGKIYVSSNQGTSFSLAPDTLGGPCNGIAHALGLFVAYTNNGRILTSTNGLNWTLQRTMPDPIGAVTALT